MQHAVDIPAEINILQAEYDAANHSGQKAYTEMIISLLKQAANEGKTVIHDPNYDKNHEFSNRYRF